MLTISTRARLSTLALIGAVALLLAGGAHAQSAPPVPGASAAAAATPASARAQDLVLNALSLLGARYRYGGDHRSTGFDCSGFVRRVYQETLGLALPHNAAQQSREGEKVAETALRPGDLVFFNTLRRAFSHVGIYIGNGEFIHAPRPGQRVQIESLSSPYWARRFDGARRLIERAADLLPSAQAEPVPQARVTASVLPPIWPQPGPVLPPLSQQP